MSVAVRVEAPFQPYYLPLLWDWMDKFRHKVLDDDGPRDQNEFVDLYIQRLKGGDRTWSVRKNDRLVGFVQVSPPNAHGLAETGSVWRQEDWSSKVVAPALCQVYSEVFATGIQKLHTTIYADFHAMADMLARVGFQCEGRLRKVRMRNGELQDVKIFGLMKKELKTL